MAGRSTWGWREGAGNSDKGYSGRMPGEEASELLREGTRKASRISVERPLFSEETGDLLLEPSGSPWHIHVPGSEDTAI